MEKMNEENIFLKGNATSSVICVSVSRDNKMLACSI